jgi:hypothetical protein
LEYWKEGPTGSGGRAALHEGSYEHSIIRVFPRALAERDGMDSIIGPYSGIVGSGWRK